MGLLPRNVLVLGDVLVVYLVVAVVEEDEHAEAVYGQADDLSGRQRVRAVQADVVPRDTSGKKKNQEKLQETRIINYEKMLDRVNRLKM